MNSNAPNNPYGLLSLLNRDQYGARPLVKGLLSSPPIAYKRKNGLLQGRQREIRIGADVGRIRIRSAVRILLSAMYSEKPSDIKAYQNWNPDQGRQIPFGDETITVPTFAENLKFFSPIR